MSKTRVTFIRRPDGQILAARIGDAEIPLRLGAPADIDGTVGANLFVEAGAATVVARIADAEIPIDRFASASVGGAGVAILGIRDADIDFETRQS